MKFKNAFAPTEDELREWAKDPDAEYPDEMSQDWDLILADFDMAPTLITLACEESPNRKFFISCLYILAGDCVRVGVRKAAIEKVENLFKLVPKDAPKDLQLWIKRSQILFEQPSSYEYQGWGYGDLAYNSDT
ncbi:MAG: hypothetical protein F6K42_23635 [Leptolyngbya sp. SIO1D8]|nr:hypothetical protein [Leptolyngbya sp. SIO1D8]